MIEFKVIDKHTGQDHSDECFIGKDGKYYFIYDTMHGLEKELLNQEDYQIEIIKHHYPYYSVND